MKVQRFTLDTKHWGSLPMFRPLPKEERKDGVLEVDPWGVLAPLRQHPDFARLIPVVDGETFSMALHGYSKPLMDKLGPEPRFQLIKVPEPYSICGVRTNCVMYDPKRCNPRSKKLPECWWPEGAEEDAKRPMAMVTLAWSEGRYVVVVEGAEFSL